MLETAAASLRPSPVSGTDLDRNHSHRSGRYDHVSAELWPTPNLSAFVVTDDHGKVLAASEPEWYKPAPHAADFGTSSAAPGCESVGPDNAQRELHPTRPLGVNAEKVFQSHRHHTSVLLKTTSSRRWKPGVSVLGLAVDRHFPWLRVA